MWLGTCRIEKSLSSFNKKKFYQHKCDICGTKFEKDARGQAIYNEFKSQKSFCVICRSTVKPREEIFLNKPNKRYQPTSLTFNSQTHSIQEWADILDLHYQTIYHRLQSGRPIEQVLDPTTKIHGLTR